ncbi:DnaJ domain-containing protein [Fusarium oxysporum Fo47]|uniref:DnaJ domain-containing protein n=1 Tax=Fusarium oxysporum Fo47 TaxID=660027 RepID=UPI002869E73D|nr:DnaJ domain-containing protein [Fusarium oxysporum Fo47]QKD60462.2 DnaJ domain-domain-containing protein [Fusarium oxysporum Fo47]
MDFIDYYKILQLIPTANTDEIKTAYRQLAKTTHPDKNREDKQATSNFQKLNDAYSTLSDTEKRRVYDLEYERQRRLNQPRFYTIGRTSESTNKNAAPFPWFSATFYAEPPPFNPEPMRLFVKIRESEDFIRQFKSCVSSTGKEVRRQKRTIQKKEEAVRALKEDILKHGTEKTREYAYGDGPSNLNRIRESSQIQAKTRRKAEIEAELKEEEEKLVAVQYRAA